MGQQCTAKLSVWLPNSLTLTHSLHSMALSSEPKNNVICMTMTYEENPCPTNVEHIVVYINTHENIYIERDLGIYVVMT